MAKLLLYSTDAVGKTMAGPAIRYWEFAKALSKRHDVILMAPDVREVGSQPFTLVKRTSGYRSHFRNVDAIVTMVVNQSMAWAAKWHGVKIILDAYDPMPFEVMEMHRNSAPDVRRREQDGIAETMNFSFRMADGILCANENQKDLWTGLLMSQKKIDPLRTDGDAALQSLVDIVPFGLPSELPKKLGQGLRDKFHLKQTDKVLLWGGGIWNWFDPLTLIEAVHQISQSRSDVKLVFMGVQAPSNFGEERVHAMAYQAQERAKQLGLDGVHVFFNYGWVPYEQRAAFLLDADVGVSTHFNHLETRYAFRTRLLDYIWAGIPIINTEGDSFSRLIEKREIGLTVAYGDRQALVDAILQIIDNPLQAERMRRNLEDVRKEFHWDRIVAPIERMAETPRPEKRQWQALREVVGSVYKARGILFPFRIALNRIGHRLGYGKAV